MGTIVKQASAADEDYFRRLVDELRKAVMVIVPPTAAESKRPGTMSLLTQALCHIAGELTALCPVDQRGQAVEAMQTYYARVAMDVGASRDEEAATRAAN